MISDVFEIVKQLPVLADLREKHRLGDQHLASNDAAPRIVWVPISDGFKRGAIKAGNASPLPRALYTRQARIEVHLWSKAEGKFTSDSDELRAMETLQQRFISAVHGVAFGSFMIVGASYPNTEGQSVAENGLKQVLTLVFEVPVLQISDITFALITDIEATMKLNETTGPIITLPEES